MWIVLFMLVMIRCYGNGLETDNQGFYNVPDQQKVSAK